MQVGEQVGVGVSVGEVWWSQRRREGGRGGCARCVQRVCVCVCARACARACTQAPKWRESGRGRWGDCAGAWIGEVVGPAEARTPSSLLQARTQSTLATAPIKR